MEENHGVLLGSGTKALYVGGTIPYEVRLESGDWRPYIPALEKQKDPLETMACVTFSYNNCLETQYRFYGLDLNFSDRFLAKMSDTQHNGNYLDKVADTARKVGLVLESEYPNNPKAQTWDEYYKEIPQEIKRKAILQSIQYEGVDVSLANLKKELKQSPIQITIPAPHPNHAVTLVYIEGTKAHYLDHYNYQLKEMEVSKIATALKIVLYMNQTKVVLSSRDNNTVWLCTPVSTMEVLQERASVEGFVIPITILNGDKPSAPKTADL